MAEPVKLYRRPLITAAFLLLVGVKSPVMCKFDPGATA